MRCGKRPSEECSTKPTSSASSPRAASPSSFVFFLFYSSNYLFCFCFLLICYCSCYVSLLCLCFFLLFRIDLSSSVFSCLLVFVLLLFCFFSKDPYKVCD